MRRSYGDEIRDLPVAYAAAQAVPETEISSLRTDLAGGPAIFIGAGGALAAAKLAAELHERFCGSIARTATPLEFASNPAPPSVTVVLISARARHPDTAAAAAAAIAAGSRKIVLVTQRAAEDLTGSLADPVIAYHRVPAPYGNDGFLATGSLLTTASMLARAYAGSSTLPERLPSFDERIEFDVRSRLLILSAPGANAAACDIEVRFNETGMADAELTDYRNFAHGRHYGLSRHLDATTLIALSTRDTAGISRRTLEALPEKTHVISMHSALTWPASALDLIVKSAKLIQMPATIAGIDLGKPPVPAFGRRLYHLASGQKTKVTETPIQRKIVEAIEGGPYDQLFVSYLNSLETWLELMRATDFAGLVLDYDGTVCATQNRFKLPADSVQNELKRLLSNNIRIGFASGRGGSLYSDLRKWVPAAQWPNVYLGLYNGAKSLTLEDVLEDVQESPPEVLLQAANRLRQSELATILSLKIRKHQLTVQQKTGTAVPLSSLYDIVASIIDRGPQLHVKLLVSGHSLDVVETGSSKTAVLDAIQQATGSESVVAIGDQGQRDGNDYKLLASTPYTLSVDRCSPDPTRCWNLNSPADRGPDGLVRYLRALRPRKRDQFRFVWSG